MYVWEEEVDGRQVPQQGSQGGIPNGLSPFACAWGAAAGAPALRIQGLGAHMSVHMMERQRSAAWHGAWPALLAHRLPPARLTPTLSCKPPWLLQEADGHHQ